MREERGPTPQAIDAFIARWDGTELAERANHARFLDELCAVLGVPAPDPAAGPGGDHRHERSVTHREADGSTSTRRIDLYKRACRVLRTADGCCCRRWSASPTRSTRS